MVNQEWLARYEFYLRKINLVGQSFMIASNSILLYGQSKIIGPLLFLYYNVLLNANQEWLAYFEFCLRKIKLGGIIIHDCLEQYFDFVYGQPKMVGLLFFKF